MIKRITIIVVLILCIFLCSQLEIEVGGTGAEGNILTEYSFVDDMGNKILIDQPVEIIVSLSPTHTENLFHIGAGSKVLAVDESSVYPYEAAMLTKYRLNKALDVEHLIASNPDVVLIEPAMNRDNTSLVSALEVAGLRVVSLMPESMGELDAYIRKLGIISGQGESAEESIQAFNTALSSWESEAGHSVNQAMQAVFIESSERGYQTVTSTSLEGQAVLLAGGALITPTLPWYIDDTSRITAGASFIKSQDTSIDLYLSLQGDGNTGASLVSMKQKELFKDLSVMKQQRIYEFKSPLISRYTFRYLDGIKEVNRMLYGANWHYTDDWNGDEVLTRDVFAEVVYDALLLPTYTVYKKDYYEFEKFHHTYGAFEDVTYKDEDFNLIETVVMRSYLLPANNGDEEVFIREALISKEDLEHFIYIWQDLRDEALESELRLGAIDIREINTVSQLVELIDYFRAKQVEE